MFVSFPRADKGRFTAPMERGDVITAHCVIQCQSQPFQISICWSDSILYYEKPIPTVAVYIGTLIKSQGSQPACVPDHFSLLLFSLTEIRTAPPYQEETLSLAMESFPNGGLIWRCLFQTFAKLRDIRAGAPQPIICKAARAAAVEPQTCWHSDLK